MINCIINKRIERRGGNGEKCHEPSVYAGSEGFSALLSGMVSRTAEAVLTYWRYSSVIPTDISGKEVTL